MFKLLLLSLLLDSQSVILTVDEKNGLYREEKYTYFSKQTDIKVERILVVSKELAQPVLTVDDGDMPEGECNLGNLVRATKNFLDLEYPEPKKYMSDYIISSTTGFTINMGSLEFTCTPFKVCLNANCGITLQERQDMVKCESEKIAKEEAKLKAENERKAKVLELVALLKDENNKCKSKKLLEEEKNAK